MTQLFEMGLKLEFIIDLHMNPNNISLLYEANQICTLNCVIEVIPDHDLADHNSLFLVNSSVFSCVKSPTPLLEFIHLSEI